MSKKRNRGRKIKRIHINPEKFLYFSLMLCVVVMVGVGVYRFLDSSYFHINTVIVNVPIEREVLLLVKGSNLFNVDMKKLHEEIIKRHPEFKSTVIKKVFPSTLQIVVQKRIPVAQIKKDGFYLIDKEGIVLGKIASQRKDLIVIDPGVYYGTLYRGKRVNNKSVVVSLSLIEALKRSALSRKFSIREINASSPLSISFLLGKVNVIIGDDDFDKKLHVLDKFLEKKFHYNISSLRYIDLRYCSEGNNIYLGYRR